MTSIRRLPDGLFLGSHAVAEGLLGRDHLQRGLYRRVLRNVYADRSVPLTHELVCRAAALLMPEEAVLGSRSAAVWWGAPTAGVRDPVTVVVPPTSAWRGPKGVRVHRSLLGRSDIVTVEEELRVTSIERTAKDVAALEKLADAVACLDAMMAAENLSEEMLRRIDSTVAGHWGSRRVKRALALADGRAMSPPESWLRVALHLSELPHPIPQYKVYEGGTYLGKVDLAWPEAKLIVEYEGAYHFDDLQIDRDDRRYEQLVAAGWRVIRLSAADMHDLDKVVDRIRAALLAPTH